MGLSEAGGMKGSDLWVVAPSADLAPFMARNQVCVRVGGGELLVCWVPCAMLPHPLGPMCCLHTLTQASNKLCRVRFGGE